MWYEITTCVVDPQPDRWLPTWHRAGGLQVSEVLSRVLRRQLETAQQCEDLRNLVLSPDFTMHMEISEWTDWSNFASGLQPGKTRILLIKRRKPVSRSSTGSWFSVDMLTVPPDVEEPL